jgi:hypothetical protein
MWTEPAKLGIVLRYPEALYDENPEYRNFRYLQYTLISSIIVVDYYYYQEARR